MVSDALPTPMRVVVVSATGMVRAELVSAFDEDFDVRGAADARAATEEAARFVPHALVIGCDDLYNTSLDDVIQRLRVGSPARFRTAVLAVAVHGHGLDLPGAFQAGADDLARWPMEADILRARVRSLVRAATLEASMGAAALSGTAGLEELRQALAQSVHLVNNSVAGISGRAQLLALTGSSDDSALVPVCMAEARKMSFILSALHRLAESTRERQPEDDRELAATEA